MLFNQISEGRFSAIAASFNLNYYLFQNFQSHFYWSGTDYVSASAWVFDFSNGNQTVVYDQNYGLYGSEGGYALAVRPGDVSLTCTDPTCAGIAPPAPAPVPVCPPLHGCSVLA